MEFALAILLLAAAVAVGIYEGLVRARASTIVVTAAAFLAISNLIASWPWFVADQPHTWSRTYLSALLFIGWVSLLVYVLPFLLAWNLAKRFSAVAPRSGLRIRDREDGLLAFDLRDLLALLGERVSRSDWWCFVEECISTGTARPRLAAAYSDSALLTGSELLKLASETRQVIDGVFEGFREGESTPWIALEAIDSTHWEVYAADPADLAPFASAFREVEEIEQRRRPTKRS